MNATQLTDQALFNQFLKTVNTSLDKNKDKFPYKQIIKGGETVLQHEPIGFIMYSDDASSPQDYYTIRFENGHINLIEHGKKGDPTTEWKTKRSFMEKVVENPEEYINNPTKLDWDWLKSRLGVSNQ